VDKFNSAADNGSDIQIGAATESGVTGAVPMTN
jgi:hypothetical protein